MARKPRIEFPGALYHVIARGNQRRRIFLETKDFEDYLVRLWSYHEKYPFILYAYCLMPNHLHLLIETGSVPLSKIMQAIQFSYTQSFNRRHRKVGHLFQGRYKAILCQKDEYLLELIRYIHLNPVRAKIVSNPKDYCFSSHRALLGIDKRPYCDVNVVLGLFGKKRKIAMKQYESFILDAIGLGHKKELYHLKDQRILGEEEFVSDVLSREDTHEGIFYDVPLLDIIKAVSKEWDIPVLVIRSSRRNRRGSFARGIVAHLAKMITGMSMKDVGHYFSKGEAAMAHRYRLLEENIEKDKQLKTRIDCLYKNLTDGKPPRFK